MKQKNLHTCAHTSSFTESQGRVNGLLYAQKTTKARGLDGYIWDSKSLWSISISTLFSWLEGVWLSHRLNEVLSQSYGSSPRSRLLSLDWAILLQSRYSTVRYYWKWMPGLQPSSTHSDSVSTTWVWLTTWNPSRTYSRHDLTGTQNTHPLDDVDLMKQPVNRVLWSRTTSSRIRRPKMCLFSIVHNTR